MEKPYIEHKITINDKKFNPKYGDDRMCKWGHPYYRLLILMKICIPVVVITANALNS